MYGSIRKSYGAKKASGENETKERKGLFGKKEKKNKDSQDSFQETSYINVEDTKNNKQVKATNESKNEKNNVMKNEFPIASVILTIVFTMMVMVLAFGFGG